MGELYTLQALSANTARIIKEYCTQRHYKCRGCRYSVRYPYDNMCVEYPEQVANGLRTCIFADCPCDWEDDKYDVL